ncbi:MAG: hypothetical protein NWF12_02350, partial [Candidatus Bathyarchaeota archaeon]|nr:hypothetical protein [Candidatus Bathyarchaeota archaeon]
VEAQMNFSLAPAATVMVTGHLRPVESARYIRGYSYEVVDPEEGDVLRFEGYTLIYGTGMNVQSYYLGLDSSVVVVPAGVPFKLSVSSAYQYDRTRGRRSWYGWYLTRQRIESFTRFEMVEGDHFLLGEGEVLQLDIRKYSLRSDLNKMERLIDALEANLTAVEESGFYLTSERRELQAAKETTNGASMKLAGDAYEAAYIDLRQAYLKATEIQNRLASVAKEALFSVNALIAFVALTALATASLVTGDGGKRLLITAGLYAPMLYYLYRIYPGSVIVSPSRFATVGVVSISTVMLAAGILPLFIKGGRSERGVSKLGALVAVFSMAMRNLKRRRLRTTLILGSILTLTMGFVALTSLSTGYGLVYRRVESQTPGASGILIRLPEYVLRRVMEEGWFYPLNFQIAEWASGFEGVASVTMKAQNRPESRPWATVDGQPIHGVLGVQPDLDPLMFYVDEALVEGEPLREDDTCLVSDELLQRPGVDIGDVIEIRGVRLRIVGSFGSGIAGVMDVDGQSILPTHQINLAPEARRPIYKAVICEPQTVVVTTLDTAVRIRYVFVSRIDLEPEPGVDPETLAKSMALSREYRIWVSRDGEVHLAYMGGMIGGKGLPIIVPWAIVILNVIVTMMNAMHERSREIVILSSIGFNPFHVSGIFLAEASVVGVIGGGIGYLLGMGLYPLMAELRWAPMVQQKVSAVWCLASLGVAIAAVFFGSIIALRRSVIVTPSLKRRWTIEWSPESGREPRVITMPLRIEERRLEDFIDYITGSLRRCENPLLPAYIGEMKKKRIDDEIGTHYTLSFVYGEGQTDLKRLKTFNTLTIARALGETAHLVSLESRGTREAMHRTGSFVRNLIISWNV